MAGGAIPFLKGHGTENDFVLIPDRDGNFPLTSAQVQALCDRRAGIGADGVIRVTNGSDGCFLMDYRNADGSLAEMCGNGARLFARFLVDAGWQSSRRFEFLTRGGVRIADVQADGQVSIGMGPVHLGGTAIASVGGRQHSGLAVDVGNPHLACRTELDLSVLDLSRAPDIDADRFPEGVNVEFYRPSGSEAVQMRVYERGSGETRSCGTGTVAVAAAHLHAAGRAAGRVDVHTRGGPVTVQLLPGADEDGAPGFGDAVLTGPAVFVARGTIDAAWWAAAGVESIPEWSET